MPHDRLRSLIGPGLSSLVLLAACNSLHAQTQLIRVAQARIIGVDAATTFNANVVGVIKPWVSTQTATGFYAYGSPIATSFNGPVPLTNNRAHLFFVQASDGLAVTCVLNRPGSGVTGSVQMARTIRPRAAMVQDLQGVDRESNWCFNTFWATGADSRHWIWSRQQWGGAETDGWMVRLNSAVWTSVRTALTASPREYCDGFGAFCADRAHYTGLTSMAAMSADGLIIPLGLDQRVVEFKPLQPCEVVAWPSSQSVCSGQTATFSVRPNTTGTATFTWYRNETPLTISGRYSVTTSSDGLESRLSIANVTSADAGVYRCQVSSACGSSFSNALQLAVPQGVPTVSSPSAVIGPCGTAVSLSVTPTGNGPFTYQWRKGTSVMHDFYSDALDAYRVIGTDQATLSIASLIPEDSGSYTCTVTTACGAVTSLPATITVVGTRPTFIQQPTAAATQRFGSAQFVAVPSASSNLAVQWQRLVNGSWVNLTEGVNANFGTATGVTTNTLQLTGIVACGTVQIRQFASNACGCWGSNAVNLTVAGPCPCNVADITGIGGPPSLPDRLITGDDYNAFITAFAAGDPLADITGIGGPPAIPDGLITGDDFNAFVTGFANGCP